MLKPPFVGLYLSAAAEPSKLTDLALSTSLITRLCANQRGRMA